MRQPSKTNKKKDSVNCKLCDKSYLRNENGRIKPCLCYLGEIRK